MSKSITIRDVPEDTIRRLATRAAATGRSLQEYLRGLLIEWAERPEPDAWVGQVRERKAALGTRLSIESILGHRDADRR